MKLFEKYDTIAVIRMAGINDRQIQFMRKELRGDAVIKMSKKRLQKRAIEKYQEESGMENLSELEENIPGQSSLVFTNMDVFELKRIFEGNKWMIPPKPGAPAPVDIWVPAGDTGLPTGQVISELNMTLKLPTRIQNDTIWIREDTKTHEKGEIVKIKQASVLKKLGVRPVESVIKIHYAWSDGDLIPADVVYMDMEQFRQDIASAYATARQLAIGLGVIDSETIQPLVLKAHREAVALLMEMPIFDETMLDDYMKKAVANANMINSIIFGGGTAAPSPAKKEKKKKKEEKKEDEDDDEEPAGIGGLF